MYSMSPPFELTLYMLTNYHEMKIKLLLLSVFTIFFTFITQAQCSGGTNGGALSPAPVSATQTMAVTNGNYYTISIPAGACVPTYVFSFCAADGGSNTQSDTQITILDNSGAYAGGYSDDFCGLLSKLTWAPTSTLAATYRILVNSYYCTNGGTGVLAYNVSNTYTNTAEYTIVGSAVYSAGCSTVTPNSTGQTGCAWDVNSTLSFASNFSYDFTVYLGASDGGADGMAFVMQNDPRGRCACGTTGGSLAAGGITNSLIVEIDTYINFEDRDDFVTPTVGCAGVEDPDHLDLWTNGVVNPDLDGNCNAVAAGERPVVANAVRLQNPVGTNYNIENGSNHILRVSWVTGAPGTFTARILNTALTTTYGVISTTLNPMTTFGTNSPYFGFTASTGGLSNQQSFCSPAILLPVELEYLKAECGEKGITVSWATASEINNKQFDVLRSEDGTNYTRIGTVSGNGTSYNTIKYSYIDETVLNSSSIYYYKLKQVDFAGNSKSYAATGNTDLTCKVVTRDVIIFPNPANETVTIDFGKLPANTIEIYNNEGELIYFSELKTKPGYNFDIATSLFANGIYLVKINTDTKIITKKINISH